MLWTNNLVHSRLPKHSYHLHLISFMCLIFFAIFNEKSHTNNLTFSSICLNLTDTVSLQNLRQLKVKANSLLRKILQLVQLNFNMMCTVRGKKFNKLSTLGGRLQISKFFRWRVFQGCFGKLRSQPFQSTPKNPTISKNWPIYTLPKFTTCQIS